MKLKKRNTYGVALFYFHLFKREMRRRQSLFAGFRHALAHSPKLIQARKRTSVWNDAYKQEGAFVGKRKTPPPSFFFFFFPLNE